MLRRMAHLAPDRRAAFEAELHNLIQDYWGESVAQGSVESRSVLTVLMYREPPEIPVEPGNVSAEAPGA
jgi:uncharacterized protein (DUF2267 family)